MTRYRRLDKEKDWCFFHPLATVPEAVMPLIRPMTADYARLVWQTLVSPLARHPMLLPDTNWVHGVLRSRISFNWVDDWNAGCASTVALQLREHLPWQDDSTVYFLWAEEDGVETVWHVFLDHWTSFLFGDEGPILINPCDSHAVVFSPAGSLYVGSRPFSPNDCCRKCGYILRGLNEQRCSECGEPI